MANNLMFLKNKVTGDRVVLAKYYPSTGWAVAFPDGQIGLINRMDREFARRHMQIGPSDLGGNEWVIEYDHAE